MNMLIVASIISAAHSASAFHKPEYLLGRPIASRFRISAH